MRADATHLIAPTPFSMKNTHRPRTPQHHPDLTGLGHRFGPQLSCEWCGCRYGHVGAERLPCYRRLMLGALAAFGRP